MIPPPNDPGVQQQLDLQHRFFGHLTPYMNIMGFVGCPGMDLGETCYDAKNADWHFVR